MAETSALNTAYTIVTAIVLAAIVIGFFVIQPMIRHIGEVREDIERQQQLLVERQAFLRSIDQKVLQLRSLGEQEQRLSVVLPEEERAQDALRILNQAAVTSGVVIQNVSSDSGRLRAEANAKRARGELGQAPAGVVPLGYSVSVTGTYQQLRAWLAALERAPRLIDVVTFAMDRSQDSADQISADMGLELYFMESLENDHGES